MKTSKLTALAVAAALAAPMAATAGNQTAPVMEQAVVILPENDAAVGSLRGSLDSNLVVGGLVLLLLGAAAAGGGS